MERDAHSPEPIVYSFVYICRNLQLSSPSTKWVHTVTLHGAPRGRKAYVQWGAAWFPKGIVMTLLSLPQCHARYLPPWLG